MANRLIRETSPYLLQHSENPVDWFPWGNEALSKARHDDKPIFLSIGYSACHWCHVMEHESFEDHLIAEYLNEHFVSIKVDREERPDLDQVYMHAVMALRGGQGGWPLSAFLTPDLEVFFGGTYWPPRAERGMPGFDHVLRQVNQTYQTRRSDVDQQAEKLTHYLVESLAKYRDDGEPLDRQAIADHATQLNSKFDERYGGFGHAPKFPHPMDLRLLLRRLHVAGESSSPDGRRRFEMARTTLDRMAQGGIYDHLGGGFARYSVDERWLVPHFEKMLYDNALLLNTYLDVFLLSHEPHDAELIHETADFVLREMTDDQGGFHSTLDADSEGQEGKFYVWTPAEIRTLLDTPQARRLLRCYGVTETGNFEGTNVLHWSGEAEAIAREEALSVSQLVEELRASRRVLFEARETRVRPSKDDKVLVSWNALMIDALARAGTILNEPRYLNAAKTSARFIEQQCRNDKGQLLHSWRGQPGATTGFLDDYSYFLVACLSLYEATFEANWIDVADGLAQALLAEFHDANQGGFFFTAHNQEALIARAKDFQDSSVPSGNAMAACGLLRLAALTGNADYREAALGTIRAGRALWQRAPTAAAQMLIALDQAVTGLSELVLVPGGSPNDTAEVLRLAQSQYLPHCVLALGTEADHGTELLDDLFRGRSEHPEGPSLYVCRDFHCQHPIVGRTAIAAELERLSSAD